jgi:hypothetical protein
MGTSPVPHGARNRNGMRRIDISAASRKPAMPGIPQGGIRIPMKGQRRFRDHIFQIF